MGFTSRREIILTLHLVLAACNSELAVSPHAQKTEKAWIETLDKLQAKPGDKVAFVGENLSLDLEIFVNGKAAIFKLDDASNGTFIVPDDAEPGLMEISFTMKNKDISTLPLMNSDSVDTLPGLPVPEESVCNTLIYKNQSGNLVQGTASCSSIPNCSIDGQTNCLSTESFPSVAAAELSSKVAKGTSLAGISGLACTIDDALENRASITGVPGGTTDQLSFSGVVSGDHITHYRYKVRSSSDPDCSQMGDYSNEIPVSVPIGTNVASEANGPIELCVLGKDDSGQWQSTATIASWVKDRTALAAAFSAQPVGVSNGVNLNVVVAGEGITHYKYKIRESADPSCSNSSGYGPETSVSLPINDSIASLADGIVELCVIGRGSSGSWQAESDITSASWLKDTSPPTANLADAPTLTNNIATLDITVGGTDVSHYKYKIRETTDAACSVAAGYSAEVATGTKITGNISALPDGAFEVCVIGRDSAGNWQTEATASSASWTKDTAAPTAAISSAPTGTNNTTLLSATVSGAGVTHYKFKLRALADSACSNAAGYSSEVAVATAVSSNISSMADGPIELCVVGRDASGNWQSEGSAATASWAKDALPPVATFSGAPTGTSLSTVLNITVAGTDVVEYKYRIRESSDPACSNSAGYSGAIAVATHITDNISAKADGILQICVIGKDSAGNWQLEGTASAASWTKDTTAPPATISNAPSGTNNTTVLDVTIAGADVTHYKYKIRESAHAACSAAAGYSSETAVGAKITSNISALGDGAIELCVIGRDASGNWQTEASAATTSWTKDTTAPAASISGEPSGTNAVTTLNISVAGAAVTHYKFKVRETADPACSNASGYSSEVAVATAITSDISGLADGALELCVIGRDASGNWQTEASAATASWTKDALPPAATLSGRPTGISLTTSLDITVAGADVVEYKYKIRESSDSACFNSADYSGAIAVATHITDDISALADGTIEICVIGKDISNNWQLEGTATTASWTKDTSAPTATISNAPSATNNTAVLDVTIAGTDVTHYKYKIRESADAACSVAAGYSAEIAVATKVTSNISALADGAFELCVIGRDAAGNWQTEASAAMASWTKDTAAPTASVSGEPTGTNSVTALNITIAGAEVSHYKFKVRESADPACSNATGYSSEVPVATAITSDISGLADGALQLCVIGRDTYGNWQAEAGATTVSWTKDALPPAATLSGQPTGSSLSTALNITVAGADVVEYKYKIREAADLPCSDSTGYSSAIAVATHITDDISALADGTIQVCVIGKDASNNWQLEGTSTTASWTKDTVAPVADIIDEPTGTNATTTLNVTIGGTDVTHYKYKIREPATTACSNSADYSSETAIATKITDSISSLAEGTIELCVIGRDAAGNWQAEASAATASWTKDTAAPTATISGEPTGTNTTTALNITVAGSDVTHYKYKIRESGDTACSNSTGYSSEASVATAITDSVSGKADGTFELCLIGRDSQGNWQAEASATTATWTKDTTAPTAIISGAPGAGSLVTSLDIAISGTDVVEYKYKIRGVATSACSNSADYSSASMVATHITSDISAMAEGAIELCVIGKDSAGNWQLEANASTATWTKDTVAPTATISNTPTATNNTTVLDVTIAGTDVSHYKYKLREAADSACSVAADYSAEIAIATKITNDISAYADGALELCVIGRDAAGNWQTEASAATASWTKDAAAPSATISGEPTGTNNTTNLNVTIAGATVTHYKYKIREAADTACSNSSGYNSEVAVATTITDSISGKADGTIELCVIGRDAYGNWQAEASATAVNWTKDTTAPTAVLSGAPTGSSPTTVLDITVSGADVVEYKYKIRENADAACSNSSGYSSAIAVATHITNNISAKAEGTIEVCVIGKDSQGNWQLEASATSESWTKDTAAPTATISGEPTGTNNATTLSITIAGTGVTEYKYKVRDTSTTACSNAGDYSSAVAVATPITDSIAGFADGAMEICVIGRDSAGNWQLEASASTETWTKDTTAPSATISGEPTGTNNTAALNVAIAGAAVTHYKYKIREAADTVCSNSADYSSELAVATPITDSISGKADGTFELCVIGRDAYGNWQAEASATAVSWTKDAAAPTVVLSGAPSGSSLTTVLDITVSGADVVEYKYKVRDNSDTACSDSTGYSSAIAVATHITNNIGAKAEGTIEVCVIGKDNQGNWQLEASATSESWTKDTVAPTATIGGEPTGTNNTTTLSITIAGTGVTEYKYKVRDTSTTVCSNAADYSSAIAVATPITDSISSFADGAMEICVIGRDVAGNWQLEANASTETWTKDTTGPTADIDGEPTGNSNATTLNVTVSGSDVTHYKYKIRASADTACSNSTDYSSEVGVATAITDSFNGKADGTIQLCVIGRDTYGNWQAEASASSVSWTKDVTPPSVNVGADRTVKVLTTLNATASDSGSGIATYAWSKFMGLGNISYTAASSEDTDVSADSDASYVLRLMVTDAAGNIGWDDLVFVWDTTAPSNPASVGFGSAYSASTSLSLSWTDSSDSHFLTHNVKICTANDCSTGCTSATTDTASPATLTGANGTAYYGCVQGEDSLGNTSSWVASLATITVDTTAPTANSISINSAATYANSLSSTLTLSATGADEMYITNTAACASDGNWESYSTSKSWNLGQSNTTATVYAKFRDFAGNQSSCINDTIIHDSLAPSSHSISIDSGAASTSTTSVTLTLAASDLYAVEMYVTNTSGCGSDGNWEAFNSSKSWTLGQTGGTATVYVAFRDAAGNVSNCVNDTITHISGPPTSPTISIEGGDPTISDTTATLSLSASSATEMYVTNTSACSSGGNWESYSTSKNWVLSANQSGSATVYVKYRNSSGLESSCESDSILIQSPNLLTNGDFELGDTTGWTLSHAGKWIVSTSNVNAGTYSATTSSPANSTSTCLYQSIDLTAAVENQVVDFNWSYGTQTGSDIAEFRVDGTLVLSLSGLSAGYTSHSALITKGASRELKWCYKKNISGTANGDYVRLDEIRVGSPSLRPPLAVSGVGSNATVALTITAPAAPPAGYLVLRGTSAVDFTPVNGTSYSTGPLGSYQVIYKGTSLTPTDTGLTNATTYHYAVYSYDSSDNYSLAATTTALPWGNYTPSSLTATATNAQVALSWTIPAGGAQTGSLIVQRAGSAPSSGPVNGTSYAVNDSLGGGTVIYKSTGTSYTKTGLTNNTTYYYQVWTYTATGDTYSYAAASDNAMPTSCTGVLYSGACWYKGAASSSCNSTCSAAGKTYNASATASALGGVSTNAPLNCRNLINNTGLGTVSGSSGASGDMLCSMNGSSMYSHGGAGTNTGNKTYSGYSPICACND